MIDPHMKLSVLGRIREDKPYSATARTAAENVFGVGERLDAVKAQADADRNLSEAGRTAKVASAAKALARDFAETTRPIRKALDDARTRRANMRPKEPDRTDVVAEMRRAELRAFVRSVPDEKRFTIIHANPRLTEAVLDGPPALSGLPPERFQVLEEARIESQFGPRLKELQEQEEVFQNAGAAADIVRTQLRQATGLSATQFEELLSPLEAAADAR